MLIVGEGGTGKSKLLKAVMMLYEENGTFTLLAKTVTTGVTSSLKGGGMVHSWAGIPIKTLQTDWWATNPRPDMAAHRRTNILDKLLLTIDKMSLLTTDNLSLISKVMSIVKSVDSTIDSTIPFGGLSVAMIGDFHQFPPVGKRNRALFSRKPPSRHCEVGRNLYLQIKTVTRLTQQMQITDKPWMDILDRARYGECTREDLDEIRKLVLTEWRCNIPDFGSPPWDNAVLITPRNVVQIRWNAEAVLKHCRSTGSVLYISPAKDSSKGEPLTTYQQYLAAQLPVKDTADLDMQIQLAVGLKMMITENISTSAHLSNSS